MGKTLTNKEFLSKLKDMNVMYTPLEDYKGAHKKIKWKCPNNDEHIFETDPSNIYDGKQKCPYCMRRKVFVGETDMWTTNPEMAKMLLDKNDGYKYFDTGSQKVDWICPNCGYIIKDKIINNVKMYGLSCPVCSDGMSFGEKFIYELLSQLNCKFIYDKTTEWSGNKRYDFYVPTMSLIIEANGIQHYEKSFAIHGKHSSRTLEEEINNDEIKMITAINNGILHYIQLDCRKSDFNYIKYSIINSELNKLFDLSCINWDACFNATITSNIILCADLWNNGMKSTKDISDYTGIHISSVISNLKKAAKSNLCDYVINYNKNRKRYPNKVLCIETQKVYEYIKDVENDGYSNSHISKCCNGIIETAYGMHWRFV